MRHPRLGPELPGKGKPEPRTVSLGRVVFDSAAEAEIERLNDELSAKGIELGEALARRLPHDPWFDDDLTVDLLLDHIAALEEALRGLHSAAVAVATDGPVEGDSTAAQVHRTMVLADNLDAAIADAFVVLGYTDDTASGADRD